MQAEEFGTSEDTETLPNGKSGVAGALGGSEHLEKITTVGRVPGDDSYYENDELKTYGYGDDHDYEPPVFPQVPQIQDL